MASKAARAKQEREEREAAWRAEEERVRKLGELFEALPEGHQTEALKDAMTCRIIDLYNNVRFEHGDVLLEFLPNAYARELLDWYFDDDAPDTFTPKAATAEYEITIQGEVPDQPQQPGRPDGADTVQAHAEIVEIAKDLVALWQSPNIQGVPRAERNAAIEDTRKRLIEAVSRL